MNRTMSMRSKVPSEAPTQGAASDRADRTMERELGISRRGLFANALDAASDTSSVRERKFADLLGGSDSGSDRDLSPTGRSVGHRLYYQGCGRERMKQEHLRAERERQLMAEMAKMTQRPDITGRARTKFSKGEHFADHAAMWTAQRDQRLRRKAQEVASERLAEVKASPTVNPRSEALLKTSGEYKGPVRHWKEHFDKFSARRHREDSGAIPASFTPNINANAVRVDVERDISQRLFQDSAARRERQAQRSYEQQAREMVDPSTGRDLFHPHALRRSSPQPRRHPDELSAQLHDESYEVARRREVAAATHPDAQHTFEPAINPSSNELAKRARKPLYMPRAQREAEEQAKREKVRRARSADASPRVGSGSTTSVDEFLRRAQRAEMTRAQKLESIRRSQDDRETSECTFQPAISRRSEEIFFSSNVHGGSPMRSAFDAGASMAGSPLPPPESTGAAARSPVAGSPSNPSTARAGVTAHPTGSSPTSAKRGGRGGASAADEFAAVMAANGVATGAGASERRRQATRARHHDPTAASTSPVPAPSMPNESPVPASPPRASAPRAGSQPGGARGASAAGSAGGDGMGDVDQYIAAFESQMYSVLEEWRKLEEV